MNPLDLVSTRYGDRSYLTGRVQTLLVEAGHPLEVDRDYGPATAAAVRETALAHGRDSDAGHVVRWPLLLLFADLADAGAWAPPRPVFAPRPTLEEELRRLAGGDALYREAGLGRAERTKRHAAYDAVFASASALCTFVAPEIAHATPDQAVAVVIRELYRENIREEWGQNRGPWVDIVRALGGSDPHAPHAYCASGVSGVRTMARAFAAELGVDNGWNSAAWVQTGRAWTQWSGAPAGHTLELELDGPNSREALARLAPGMTVTRSRTARPMRDRDLIERGDALPGHQMIVRDVTPDAIVFQAFNSSGSGHSSSTRGGRLAIEVATRPRTSVATTHGVAAWSRIVGATSLLPIP